MPFSTFERVSTPTGSTFEAVLSGWAVLFRICCVQDEPNAVLRAVYRLIPSRARAVCPEAGSGLLGLFWLLAV